MKYCQMNVALENLELLPQILEKLTLLEKNLENFHSKRWMNVKELSHYLGYSEDHIYKLKEDIFCEGIHFFKRGKLFFDRIEIDKWVINGSNNDQNTLAKKRVNEILDSVIGITKR